MRHFSTFFKTLTLEKLKHCRNWLNQGQSVTQSSKSYTPTPHSLSCSSLISSVPELNTVLIFSSFKFNYIVRILYCFQFCFLENIIINLWALNYLLFNQIMRWLYCHTPVMKFCFLLGKAVDLLVSCLGNRSLKIRAVGASALWALLHNYQRVFPPFSAASSAKSS